MSIGIITQARMTSTRLPGKVLMPFAGRNILSVHMSRLARSGLPVFVATTTNTDDDPIEEQVRSSDVGLYRGSEHDVQARFLECADQHDLEHIVRVTSDCPLVDGEVIAAAVSQYMELQEDDVYMSNIVKRTYPRGFDFEVFSCSLLQRMSKESTPEGREHVTYDMYNKVNNCTLKHYTRSQDGAENYRLTLDTSKDYEMLKALSSCDPVETFSAEGIITCLRENPEVAAINAEIEQKKLP